MIVGLIGPPQSGKSTLFAALTGKTIDPAAAFQEHTASIVVPDGRIDYLAGIYKPKKVSYATVDVCDFPGISSSDDHGKEQYRKHLPNIRLWMHWWRWCGISRATRSPSIVTGLTRRAIWPRSMMILSSPTWKP